MTEPTWTLDEIDKVIEELEDPLETSGTQRIGGLISKLKKQLAEAERRAEIRGDCCELLRKERDALKDQRDRLRESLAMMREQTFDANDLDAVDALLKEAVE